MKKALLDVVFTSERRKNVLLMLQDGPEEMELILERLHTTRQALLPQMRILKDHNLIYQFCDAYGLKNTGKLLVNKMKPFLGTLETLEENSNYLATHKVDSIPEHFLNRLCEVEGCKVIDPGHINAHQLNAEFIEEALSSKYVYFVCTFMHPGYNSILKQLLDKGIEVSVIDSKELVEKLLTEIYEVCRHFLSYKNFKIYRYEKDLAISTLTVIDNGFLLRLRLSNNEFSNKQLVCVGLNGRKWGKELYDYYLKDSTLRLSSTSCG
jgi:predicted transcriptional regulator